MTRVLLIRHGRTDWNRERVFRGRADVPLSTEGSQQAQALAERLAGESLAAVYTSSLSRALATAAPIAQAHGLLPRPEAGLIDMSYGEWEGQPQGAVQARWPELFARWQTAPEQVRPPGGETLAEVMGRAAAALKGLLRQHPDDAIAVVSHRVVCKLLLCSSLGLDPDSFWCLRVDTCSLSAIEMERERFVVTLMNATSHLRHLPADAGDF
jgi:broad specificity phosphatase PhoE